MGRVPPHNATEQGHHGKKGKKFGILGKDHGAEAKNHPQHGIGGKKFGIDGKDFGIKGKDSGIKGKADGHKGALDRSVNRKGAMAGRESGHLGGEFGGTGNKGGNPGGKLLFGGVKMRWRLEMVYEFLENDAGTFTEAARRVVLRHGPLRLYFLVDNNPEEFHKSRLKKVAKSVGKWVMDVHYLKFLVASGLGELLRFPSSEDKISDEHQKVAVKKMLMRFEEVKKLKNRDIYVIAAMTFSELGYEVSWEKCFSEPKFVKSYDLEDEPDSGKIKVKLGPSWLWRFSKKWNLNFVKGTGKTAYDPEVVMAAYFEAVVKIKAIQKVFKWGPDKVGNCDQSCQQLYDDRGGYWIFADYEQTYGNKSRSGSRTMYTTTPCHLGKRCLGIQAVIKSSCDDTRKIGPITAKKFSDMAGIDVSKVTKLGPPGQECYLSIKASKNGWMQGHSVKPLIKDILVKGGFYILTTDNWHYFEHPSFRKELLKHGIILVLLPPGFTGAIQFEDLHFQRFLKQWFRTFETEWLQDPDFESEWNTNGEKESTKAPTIQRHISFLKKFMEGLNCEKTFDTNEKIWKQCGPFGENREGEEFFLNHLYGCNVGEGSAKNSLLPKCLNGFDPFQATAEEVLNHKRKGGWKAKKSNMGVRGKGYKREHMEVFKANAAREADTGLVDNRKVWLDSVDSASDKAAQKILEKLKWRADRFSNREPTKAEVKKVGKYVGQKAFPKFVKSLNNADVEKVLLESKKSKPLFLKTIVDGEATLSIPNTVTPSKIEQFVETNAVICKSVKRKRKSDKSKTRKRRRR